MEVLVSQSFDPVTSDILISSWRQGTTSNYSHYVNEWFTFSKVNNILPVEPPIQVALTFLTSPKQKRKIIQSNMYCKNFYNDPTKQYFVWSST